MDEMMELIRSAHAGDKEARNRLVAENMGFTFLSESGIRRTSYMDRLSFFTVGEPPLTSPLALVYKKNGFLSPAARMFMNLTKDYYRQFDRGAALEEPSI